jgi:hypothetical protein
MLENRRQRIGWNHKPCTLHMTGKPRARSALDVFPDLWSLLMERIVVDCNGEPESGQHWLQRLHFCGRYMDREDEVAPRPGFEPGLGGYLNDRSNLGV